MAFGSIPGFRKRTAATTSPEANAHKESPQPSIEDPATLKRGTRTRRNAIVVSCFCYVVAVVFLILVSTNLSTYIYLCLTTPLRRRSR